MLKICLAALAFASSATFAHAQQQPPPDCSAPEHRAFDFWIGEWDAFVTGTETLAGRSTIAAEHKGCVITEHWRSMRADYSGRSLNIYDRANGHWEQFWVDSQGVLTHFVGAPSENGMVLTAPARGGAPANRMTFTRNSDGSVRQFGEVSNDGQTWTSAYDFTYRPHAE
jgi:hypothetical protein